MADRMPFLLTYGCISFKPQRIAIWVATLALVAGCGILEVENPNNLLEDDLANPTAAEPMANGLEAAVTR